VAACAARALADDGRGPLATFSLVFPGQREDESTWIDAATASSRVDATRIDATRLDPFARVDTWLDALGEPFFGPNVYLMDACWAAAAERGCAAFLDGFDGDTVVSHGTNAIAEWALGGRIVRALREARGVARSFERPFARVAARSILRPALPRTAWRSVRGRRSHDIGLVHRDLAVRTRLAERVADVEPPARTEVAGHLRRLRSPMLSVGLEISCRLGASRGVEVRSPFVDQDLVELCLSLPPEQKLRDGTTRFVLRRAMEGLLPPVVCERSGKTDVSGNFHRNVARGHPVLDEVASGADDLDGLVDPVALRSVVARYRDAGGGSEAMSIWSTLLLLRWLRAARPERSGRG
jgi:asparagine synthase (glutamine-hydrolysing)